MALIPLGTARRVAIERIISQMRAHFEDEITEARGRLSLSPLPKIDVPVDRSYTMVDPEHLAALPKNYRCWVFVFPDGPRVTVSQSTGGAAFTKQQTTLDINIVVVYRFFPEQLPQDGDTVVISQDELMRYRAEVYADAMINTIQKYAKSPDAIHELEFVSDVTYPIYLDKFPSLGLARTTFRVTQMVSKPESVCC